MVKKGDNLPEKHLRKEPYNTSADFEEVFLESMTAQNVHPKRGQASNETSKPTIPKKRECSTSPKICVAPMNLIIDDGGEMANTEYQHETDLEAIELAIANKRTELRKQRDMDHMKEKAALVAKIQELEHARLTRQHNFRVAITRKQENIERLKKEFQTGLENHCKKLEEFRAVERTKTAAIKAQIDTIRTKRDHLAPEIGLIEGQLMITLKDIGEVDNSFTKHILDDLEQKCKDTSSQNVHETQQLDQFTAQQVDILMDEINGLEQDVQEERHQAEQTKETHSLRLGELEYIVQKGKRHGPVQLDEEKEKIQEEVKTLKEYWRELRGHIEEQVEDILEQTEKKKFEGRDRLMKQRQGFFQERQKSAAVLGEMTAKLYERQREVETARQLFYDRVQTKTAELDEIEDIHAERLKGRCQRRDKRMRELEFNEQEIEKRLKLEADLLDIQKTQLQTGFEVKRSHLQGAITETEVIVNDVLQELREPNKEDQERLAELQGNLAKVEQQREFLKIQSEFAKEAIQHELDLIKEEKEKIGNKYATQLGAKQKEFALLRKVEEKLRIFERQQVDINRKRFTKETDKIVQETNNLEAYFDNLTVELNRLKSERLMLRDEYIKTQEGIRNAMLKDEDDVAAEREQVHHLLDAKREQFARTIQSVNAQIVEARRKRHEMTAKFKKDINSFTAKAMGIGLGSAGGGQARSNMLKAYEDEIKKYSLRVHAINEKLELLVRELQTKKDKESEQKLKELQGLQKENEKLQKILAKKQKSMKEGNMLLQLFSDEDSCLYCSKSNPTRSQKNRLDKLHDENRRLTEKLTSIFRKEKEYDRVSSKQLEELRSMLVASMNTGNLSPKSKRAERLKQKRFRTGSQSSASGYSLSASNNE